MFTTIKTLGRTHPTATTNFLCFSPTAVTTLLAVGVTTTATSSGYPIAALDTRPDLDHDCSKY